MTNEAKQAAVRAVAEYLHEKYTQHEDSSCFRYTTVDFHRIWKQEAPCMDDAEAILDLPEVRALFRDRCENCGINLDQPARYCVACAEVLA